MCGIGGRTIEEAKARLSYREFLAWVAYRYKRGRLNIGMRVEHAGASSMAHYSNLNTERGGYKVTDFMMHEEEPEITMNQAMESWS